MSPEWRVSAIDPADSLPTCRVLSSLCCPLLSGALPASSNSLCSVIPPQHPESRLGSLCRQQAGEAAQLISQVSQLPEITADPLWPDAQFFHSLSFVYFGHFSEDLWSQWQGRAFPVPPYALTVCRDRTWRALPPWAGGRQVLLLGMVAMVLGVTVLESFTR